MEAKIALIAPHSELAEIAQEVQGISDYQFDIFIGDLAVGLEKARELEKQDYDVIISRGGTYLVIKEEIKSIPIVEIQVTGYDLIRALKQIPKARNLALCGYPNIFLGAKDITDLFGFTVQNFLIQSNEDLVRQQLLDAQGIELVVGDTAGCRVGSTAGFQTFLIQSGQEAIITSLQEAKRAAVLRFAEAKRAEELKTILNFIDNGIISVNKDGIITVVNPAAQEKLGLSKDALLGNRAQDVIHNSQMHRVLKTGKAELGELHELSNGDIIVANRIPLMVQDKIAGVVSTFQDLTKLQDMERKVRRKLSKQGLVARYGFHDIVHRSPVMTETIREARKYATVDSTLLITAETGTGKELFAQSIHNASSRRDGPFVAVNCGAFPASLLESELFGYAEGAFTGARKEGKPGIFELAHGGTLLLDEIGEIPLPVQIQLLRVLQERSVRRIGDDKVLPVDVRIIAATNKDIYEMVESGDFRADLYYRLDVLRLKIPPLRRRPGDIPVLFRHFADGFNWSGDILSPGAQNLLENYQWPGNVRELENMVEKLWLLSDNRVISTDLVQRVIPNLEKPAHSLEANAEKLILEALEKCNGDKARAAEMLGISRTTLWRKLNSFQNET